VYLLSVSWFVSFHTLKDVVRVSGQFVADE